MPRLVITGAPRAGKTTLSAEIAPEADHTDAFRHQGDFPKQEQTVAALFDRPDGWTVEGVTATRALRRWLRENPRGRPADRIIYLHTPYLPLSKQQENMRKGLDTVWREILPELRRRGVEIEERR